MRQRSENLGESPCPSAIDGGQGGHQDFHETIEKKISHEKQYFHTQKRKARFFIEIKVGIEKDSI